MFITGMIILNTITMMLDMHPMSAGLVSFVEGANTVFTWIFIVEMCLKLVGLGFRGYMSDSFNIFDFVIVWFSIVEMIMEATGGQGGAGGGISALRTFRLLRVFKLARSWKELRQLLETILESVRDAANATVLLLIIMFIFTLLGMQLFGGKFQGCGDGQDEAGIVVGSGQSRVYTKHTCFEEKPRTHFDTFWWAFVTVFQVLTGENWNDALVLGIHAVGDVAWIYFTLLNIVGNYMIMNLFLAILLANFEDPEEDEEDDKENEKNVPPSSVVPVDGATVSSEIDASAGDEDAEEEIVDPDAMHLTSVSLFVLGEKNGLRGSIFSLVNHPRFDQFILVLIGISSIALAVDEPYIADCKASTCSTLFDVLTILDYILTVLFTLEMLLKIVALGFILHPYSYLRNPWNMLDFVIVIISWLAIAMAGASAVKSLKAIRALRAFRPLRVVRRFPQMKLVVNSMIRSLPQILNVTTVLMLFFIIFGVLGVNNWKGSMAACNDGNVESFAECVGTFNLTQDAGTCGFLPSDDAIEQCIRSGGYMGFPRIWTSSRYNFDNIFNAILTLFEVSSGEMWPDIMYDTVDAVGVDHHLVPEYNTFAAFYYIWVQIVFAFLMLNVFVGVVIDNYNKMKEESEGSALLTDGQKLWVETMKLALSSNVPERMKPPNEEWRMRFFKIVEATWFEVMIMGFIMSNTILLSFRFAYQGSVWETAIETGNLIFAIIFLIEAILKLIGLGPNQYFKQNWNRFDFTLVVLSFVGKIFDVGQFATLLRVARVARIFRLVRRNKGLLNLFKTLIYSIPSLGNVFAILLLIFFIFSCLFMNLFAGVKEGDFITGHSNFNSFGGSFNTLFRVSTGESYNGIMHDCMIQPPYCVVGSNCGSPTASPILFCIFFVISNYMLLNLLIGIILDNFGDQQALSDSEVSEENLDQFKECWADHDPHGTGYIASDKLLGVLMEVDHPIGFKHIPIEFLHEVSLRKFARKKIASLDIPELNGKVSFKQTLAALTEWALPDLPDNPNVHNAVIIDKVHKSRRRLQKAEVRRTSTTGKIYSTKQIEAAKIMQSFSRRIMARQRIVLLRKKLIEAGKLQQSTVDAQQALETDKIAEEKLECPEAGTDVENATTTEGTEAGTAVLVNEVGATEDGTKTEAVNED
jgi:hypothetical protein